MLKFYLNSKDPLMCNIIINSFYLSDKILLNNYIYIIWNIQLTTNVGIHVTPFLKRVNILKSFVHLELVLTTWYMMLLNYVWLCNFEESYIKLPNFIQDFFFFFQWLAGSDFLVGSLCSFHPTEALNIVSPI